MRESTEKAAIWGVVGVVLAALITGFFTYMSRSSDRTASHVLDSSSPRPTTSIDSTEKPTKRSVPRKAHETEAEVGEGKSFTDEVTGFVFAVDEITDWLNTSGVLSRYTLPDGTKERMHRWPVGHRVDFEFQGRKFFMVIQDIDYERKIAKIKIKEISP